MSNVWEGPLEKIDDYRWRIPKDYMKGMRVPGLIYANERMLPHIKEDNTPQQVANVAHLPGIVKYSLAMPDIHWGYGLPIGGVAATLIEEGGVISPGGVGSDINCGVGLLRTSLSFSDIKERLQSLLEALFHNIPSGVGSKGYIKLSFEQEEEVLLKGARWAVEKGYGWEEDLEFIEEGGQMQGADPAKISDRAMERGRAQLGTLGSGNHFLEIQVVEEVYNEKVAKAFGLFKGQVTVMIHSGSRGFGYQVCDDYIERMMKAVEKYKISLPDAQLACAPFESAEGKDYFAAMVAAANYAWANRECIMHWTRETFERCFGVSAKELGMKLVYDVAHNIAKIEEHVIDGKKRKVCVHRKGATRAFPAFHPAVPAPYKEVGQPVIVPGDMGRASYVLVGTQRGMEEAFGTACHGAGRVLSRTKALKIAKGRQLQKELQEQGVLVWSADRKTLAEEMPEAYKNVEEVVDVLQGAGIAEKVVKMRPVGVVKG